MSDDKVALRDLNFRQICPWLMLFRAFRIALDPKKLILAAAGLLLMTTGWWAIAKVFKPAPEEFPTAGLSRTVEPDASTKERPVPSPEEQQQEQAEKDLAKREAAEQKSWRQKLTPFEHLPWDSERWNGFGMQVPPEFASRPTPWYIVDRLVAEPIDTLWQLATNWRLVLQPVRDLTEPFQRLFDRDTDFRFTLVMLACALWAVLVWAIFGGAITRAAAVQLAREEKISLVEALRFSGGRFLSYVGAPFIPLCGIGAFAALCALGGLISLIPYFGEIFAGVLWILPLIAGLLMAVILLGWAVGWPLMFGTISMEGSDAFDALSRAFAYAFQRPWHYLFYAVVAVVIGSLGAFVVTLLTQLLVYMSYWGVTWGTAKVRPEEIAHLFAAAPDLEGWRGMVGADEGGTFSYWESAGAACAGFWLYGTFLLMAGFVYSYFWCSSTIIYCLLRRDVDCTDLDEIYLEDAEDDDLAAAGPGPATVPGPGGAGAAGDERQPVQITPLRPPSS
jgi:hypothetical protein